MGFHPNERVSPTSVQGIGLLWIWSIYTTNKNVLTIEVALDKDEATFTICYHLLGGQRDP